MTTNFTAVGDKLGLILDRPLLERMGIDEQTPVMVTSDETGLHIRPIRFAEPAEVARAAARVSEIHADTLARLAQ